MTLEDGGVVSPGDEVVGDGERGLVPASVKAEVEHMEVSAVPEDEGAVDGLLVVGSGDAAAGEDGLRVPEGGLVGEGVVGHGAGVCWEE